MTYIAFVAQPMETSALRCQMIIMCYEVCKYELFTQDGWTALMSATMNGHTNVMETLLKHGASINLKMNVSALQ